MIKEANSIIASGFCLKTIPIIPEIIRIAAYIKQNIFLVLMTSLSRRPVLFEIPL